VPLNINTVFPILEGNEVKFLKPISKYLITCECKKKSPSDGATLSQVTSMVGTTVLTYCNGREVCIKYGLEAIGFRANLLGSIFISAVTTVRVWS
jgi:hypothetical protein